MYTCFENSLDLSTTRHLVTFLKYMISNHLYTTPTPGKGEVGLCTIFG